MWQLSGDDVQRAKEELKGRRAAIQARYDREIKELDSAIADIDTFERAALNFVASFKGADDPAASVAEPDPAPEQAAADSAGEPQGAAAEAERTARSEPATTEKGSSRWRMRLSGTEASL